MDCGLETRFDLLTDKEIQRHFLTESKNANPNWTRQQHREFAREQAKKAPVRDKVLIKKQQKEDLQKFNDKLGVFCLSQNSLSTEMWNKYGNEHKGFCVGFSPLEICRNLDQGEVFGPIKYLNPLEDVLPSDKLETQVVKRIFQKESKWAFEKEFRVCKGYFSRPFPPSDTERKVILPVECYKEIILGAKMPRTQRDEIIQICKQQKLSVVFYEAVFMGSNILILPYKV